MRYTALIFGALLAALAGCQNQSDVKKSPTPPKKTVNIDVETPKPETPKVRGPALDPPEQTTKIDSPTTPKVDTPPPAAMPKVYLSESWRATCLVQVGDTMPPGELSDADGKPVALASLLGSRATVVVFWSEGDTTENKARAATALDDLQQKVAGPHGAEGVNVVAINVGEPTAVAKAAASQVKYPVLSDSDSSYFAKVAKDKENRLRVYLLDASGKILWFDMEFTRDTRRYLQSGLAAILGGA